MLTWFKKIFSFIGSSDKRVSWENLVPGDYVRVYLKDPKQVGIISTTQSLTYQRLDNEDLTTKKIDGFIVRTKRVGIKPANIDTLEIDVVKRVGNKTKLVTYLLLREEIEYIKFIEDKKHE